MNLPPSTGTRAGAPNALLILLAVVLCGSALVGVALARSLRVPPHPFPDFRERVLLPLRLGTCSEVQVNAPPLVFTLARLVSHCVDIETEARSALRTLRNAQVNVYKLSEQPTRRVQLELIERMETHMRELGWTRCLCVLDHHDVVLAHVSDSIRDGDSLEVCVVVLSNRDLVIVGARCDAEALSQLVNVALSRHRDELLTAFR